MKQLSPVLCWVFLGFTLLVEPYQGPVLAQSERAVRTIRPTEVVPPAPPANKEEPAAENKEPQKGPEKPKTSEKKSTPPPPEEPKLQARPVTLPAAPVPSPAAPSGRPVIVIDPGHGGSKVLGSLTTRTNSSPNNATSPGGILEKDLTLQFSRILREAILSRGAPVAVVLTRDEDKNIDFKTRAELCNVPGAKCVVSIHFNASDGRGSAIGSLAVVEAPDRNDRYAEDAAFASGLAAACSKGVQEYLPDSKSRGVITDSHLHGGVGSNFFFQLARQSHLTDVPKCFLEVEFIDSKVVEKALLEGNREVKFRTIADQIAEYLIGFALQNAP